MNRLHLPRLIAVTGREASGKDSYATHLAELGYLHVAAGDVIREYARQAGHKDPIPREILSQVGDDLKRRFGPSPIVTSSLERLRREGDTHVGLVISGLRRTGELLAFKQRGGVSLWIEASDEKRFANQQYRARGDDRPDYEAFLKRSKIEYYGSTQGGTEGVNLEAIERMADVIVHNDAETTLAGLFADADRELHTFYEASARST